MADTPTRKERRAQRKLAKKALAKDPQGGQVVKAAQAFEDGMALHQAGQLAKAEAAYQSAVTANGEFAEAHLNLGVVLHAQENFDAALGPIRRALTLNPAMAEAHYALAAVYQDQDNPEDAAAGFTQALTIDPDFILAHCLTWALSARFPVVEPRLTAFLDRMRHRPAFARAAAL